MIDCTPHHTRGLRKASAEYLTSLPFDGFAVGGALGKDREELKEVLSFTMPQCVILGLGLGLEVVFDQFCSLRK